MSAAGLGGEFHPGQRQQRAIFLRLVDSLHNPITGASGLAVNCTDGHAREQCWIIGDWRVYYALVVPQMPAEQCLINLCHTALAELVAKCGINRLIAGNHHHPGGPEIKAMNHGTARETPLSVRIVVTPLKKYPMAQE